MKLNAVIEMRKRLESLHQEIRSFGRQMIHEAVREFIEEFPEVAGITWVQYTPYFNDGDICTFRVCEVNLKLDKKSRMTLLGYEDLDDTELWLEDHWQGDQYDLSLSQLPRNQEIYTKYRSLVEGILNRDLFKIAFGDDVAVTITKEEMRIEPCEHD